ncbi:MAG TPA: glycosyltransferase family 2 protein [Acidimicrobiales bacterium]|nr:glycosyltransferase family 2 protein [Acidimicrobiales bacterium]
MTLATVLINSFNYAGYLGAAITSALDQDWPETEVVVVDDGSTDESREVIEQFGDRVEAVLKSNGGQASAFNAGFERARGEVMLFLDADDWFLPGKVRTVMETFAAHPNIGWCFHPLAYDGGPAGEQRGATGWIDARAAMRRGRAHGALVPATTGISIRRPLLERILPMPEHFRITADNFVKTAALALAPGIVLDEALAVQRIHAANAFTGSDGTDPRRAVLELQIAAELRRRWPEVRQHAVRRGLGGLKAMAALDEPPAEATAAAAAFLEGCSPTDRLRVRAHRQLWRWRR